MVQEHIPKTNLYKDNGEDGDIIKKWWTGDPKRLFETIWPLVNSIRQSQSVRHTSNIRFYNLYANQSLNNLSAARYNTTNNMGSYFGESSRLTYNVVKSCVDSARSRIGKERPRPYFLTERGNWNLQRRAQKLNGYVLGLFDQMGEGGLVNQSLYSIGSECFLDACISGTGTAKMFIKDGKVVAERFISDELIIDQFEGIYRTPRSAHQVKYVDREVLKDTYPEAKYAFAIESATAAQTGNQSETQDMIPVVESWHLPSGKNAKDGLRVVTIQTGTLKTAPWTKDYFPFLVQRWSLRPVGYYGIGLAEELQGIQREINYTLSNIQLGLRRVAVPKTWMHISDHNPKKKMTNQLAEIGYYKEQPPTTMTATAFNPETYNHVDRLFNKAYEITGISQLSAMSQKPSGLDSGTALRNYQQIESERFSTVQRMYEDFFVPQATYMALDFLDELLEQGIDTTVVMKDGLTQQPVKYSEVRIDRADFTIKAYPTSLLPTEPSGKFAAVQEGVEAGFWGRDEALDLLDYPDVNKLVSVTLAVRRAATAYVEKLIDDGKYLPIEPYADMDRIRDLCQAYYLEGRSEGMPEDRLKLLRRVMQEIQIKTEEIQAAAQEDALAAQAEMAEQQAVMDPAMEPAQQAIPPGPPPPPPQVAI